MFQEREALRQLRLGELRKDISLGLMDERRGRLRALDMGAVKAKARSRRKAGG
jgi:hypothetical protein